MNSSPAAAASRLKRRWIGQRPRTVCWCSACMVAGRRTELQAMAKLRAIPFTGSARRRRSAFEHKVAAKRFAAIAAYGAGRHCAGRNRRGVCRIRQADRKAGARRFELRADLRQRQQDLIAVRTPPRPKNTSSSPSFRALKRPQALSSRTFGLAAADRDRPGGGRVRLHSEIPAFESRRRRLPGRRRRLQRN